MAATLITKATGGLPVILGVWIWGRIVALRSGQSRDLSRPRFLRLLIGGGIFAIFVWAAKQSLKHHGLPADFAGVKEGASRLYLHSFGDLFDSLFVFLPSLFAFALPMSLAMPLAFDGDILRVIGRQIASNLVTTLVAAVLIGWAIYIVTGNPNPRYAYPTLMLLCPLAGAIAVPA